MSEIKNVDIIEDELLNRLENRVEGADGFQELRSFFDWYKANRTALEAPPLKFKQNVHGYWYEVYPDGTPVWDNGSGQSFVHYHAKEDVEKCVGKRGLRAEFIKEGDDAER